eukprot:3139399-Prymnesium_polylepis.1
MGLCVLWRARLALLRVRRLEGVRLVADDDAVRDGGELVDQPQAELVRQDGHAAWCGGGVAGK